MTINSLPSTTNKEVKINIENYAYNSNESKEFNMEE